MLIARLVVCCAMLALAACATAPKHQAVLEGTANVAEFVDLPPEAIFEAFLEDVSRADAPATRISSSQLNPAGPPPFKFKIAYDRQLIDPRHRYAVRARVMLDGRVMFTSDAVYPVLTAGTSARVDLLLHRASTTIAATPLAPLPAVFEGTMPCADCPGIHYRLTLNGDGSYTLQAHYQERTLELDEAGKWFYAPSEHTLRLAGSDGSTELFHVASPDRLEKLDANGKPIESKLNYALTRMDQSQPHIKDG